MSKSAFIGGGINLVISIILIFSCIKKQSNNILSRNENGYEIPQDILINNEEPSSSIPRYFKMANFEIFLHEGKQKYSKGSYSNNENLYEFSEGYPGIPIRIISPENVPNFEYNITFKTDFNLSSCRGVLFKLSKNSLFIIVSNFNSLPKETCQVMITVSTPDNLNKINRFLSVTWNNSYSYWCENSAFLNVELYQYLGRKSCHAGLNKNKISHVIGKCLF